MKTVNDDAPVGFTGNPPVTKKRGRPPKELPPTPQGPLPSGVQEIALESIAESDFNPRRTFDAARLNELAESLKSVGVLQPIVIRPRDGGFEVVCGARRLRAARLAELATIPCVVRSMTDSEALDAAVIENLQREDVSPLEEAEAYQAMIDRGGLTPEEIAARIKRGATYVYTRLRLAKLAPEVRSAVESGELSIKCADVLSSLPIESQKPLMEMAVGAHGRGMTPAALRDYVADKLHKDLAGAPFGLDDEALVPGAGSCSACPKLVGNAPALFSEFDGDRVCTDLGCYAAKVTAFIDRQVEERKLQRLSVLYYRDRAKGVLAPAQWTEVKSGNPPNSHLGIIVDGARAGAVVRFTIPASASKPKADAYNQGELTGDQQAEAEERARNERLERKEELRKQKAETLARQRIFAEIRRLFEDDESGVYVTQKFAGNPRCLCAMAVHLVMRSGLDGARAPNLVERDYSAKLLRLTEKGEVLRHWNLQMEHFAAASTDPVRVWHSMFIEAAGPELVVNDRQKQPPFVLETFAAACDLDFEHVRVECDLETRPKKERLSRFVSPGSSADRGRIEVAWRDVGGGSFTAELAGEVHDFRAIYRDKDGLQSLTIIREPGLNGEEVLYCPSIRDRALAEEVVQLYFAEDEDGFSEDALEQLSAVVGGGEE